MQVAPTTTPEQRDAHQIRTNERTNGRLRWRWLAIDRTDDARAVRPVAPRGGRTGDPVARSRSSTAPSFVSRTPLQRGRVPGGSFSPREKALASRSRRRPRSEAAARRTNERRSVARSATPNNETHGKNDVSDPLRSIYLSIHPSLGERTNVERRISNEYRRSPLHARAPRWCARDDTTRRPQSRRDHPLNLSILLSGGKETNKDFLSSGERRGMSPALNPAVRPPGNVVFGRIRQSRGAEQRPSPS